MVQEVKSEDRGVTYTADVDLNTDATTDVYDPSIETTVYGVWMPNGGSTAVVQLELTDGSTTVVLTPGQTAGDGIAFTDDLALDEGQKLQVNVTTVEGSTETSNAAVSHGEQTVLA